MTSIIPSQLLPTKITSRVSLAMAWVPGNASRQERISDAGPRRNFIRVIVSSPNYYCYYLFRRTLVPFYFRLSHDTGDSHSVISASLRYKKRTGFEPVLFVRRG